MYININMCMSCPFISKGSRLEYHITFSCHVSLVFFHVEQFLSSLDTAEDHRPVISQNDSRSEFVLRFDSIDAASGCSVLEVLAVPLPFSSLLAEPCSRTPRVPLISLQVIHRFISQGQASPGSSRVMEPTFSLVSPLGY